MIGTAVLTAANDDDALAFRAVLEVDRHAAGFVMARTDGHMHPTEDLLAVMNSDIVLTILLGLCARDMGTEATQVYVLLEKGIARDALMPALAHTLRRKVESLKYLADRLSIPVDAILRLLDGLTREDNMPAFLRVIHKLTDDLPNGNRRLLGLRFLHGDILRTFRSAELKDRMQDRHDLAPGPLSAGLEAGSYERPAGDDAELDADQDAGRFDTRLIGLGLADGDARNGLREALECSANGFRCRGGLIFVGEVLTDECEVHRTSTIPDSAPINDWFQIR